MSLSTLPTELILRTAEILETESDVNSLTQCSRRLYVTLNQYLYFHRVQQKDKGEATLIWAAKRGRDGTARILFQVDQGQRGGTINKIDPNCADPKYGLTALSWAAANGHESVVQVLLERKEINPDLVNRVFRTPLSHAAENGHVGVAKLLLTNSKGRVDPNASHPRSYLRRTPLLWAGSPRATNAIEEGTQMNFSQPFDKDESEYNPWSAGSAYKAILDLLIEHGADIEAMGRPGCTPLNWAAGCGYKMLVELLLDKGAEINPKKRKFTLSPLYWASKGGHAETVALLIQRGAKVDARALSLTHAAENGYEEVVKLLVERTTSREKVWRDSKSWLPLFKAASNGHAGTVEVLLEAHARKWPEIPIGSNSLFLAACRGHDAVVKMLIAAGVAIDSDPTPFGGLTTLAAAVIGNHKSTVKLLLNSGIDVHINVKDERGWTALTWAAIHAAEPPEDKELADILLQHGADSSFLEAPNST